MIVCKLLLADNETRIYIKKSTFYKSSTTKIKQEWRYIMSFFDLFKKKPSKQKKEEQEGEQIKHSNHTNLYRDKVESIPLMKNYSELPFSFIDLPYIVQNSNANEKIYLFTEENQQKAKSFILSLNGFIDEAKHQCATIAPNRIKETDLEFNAIDNKGFDFFRVNPTTNTGKTTKYPMSIVFSHDIQKKPYWNDNIFGEIFLLKNGDIGKASIHQWYKNQRHSIFLSYENNKTIVSRIEH